SAAVLTLLYFGWWWTNRRIRLADRLYGFVLIVGAGIAVTPLCHKTFWFGVPTTGLPVVLTVWTIALFLVGGSGLSRHRWGLFAVVAPTWASLTLIRVDGVDSDLKADIRWRWSPSAEDLFRAERERRQANDPGAPVVVAETALALSPGDWPSFRGTE